MVLMKIIKSIDRENSYISIPPYSMSLWNQCLKLLSTNSTITNLSITHNCRSTKECEWDENEDYENEYTNTNIDLITKSIVSMLDQNTTLESINIFAFWDFNEISYLTKNTKCKIS
ncbi:hypothetical protein DDB_G0291552 [Dictyostelium discoideum AX4]|uniref:Uncharacterized protein n=1 Tax=Dictyostelium discoideum TaxID=44689 RepID=Q54EE9_DICDI|nr:hypothetical protein DDB_G0291552 [Dictyostelium discoideum AX4]EAL61760.1 hypothetical protein DDB_G0291552 [Dictyostelium discoideum AX4]|eukprot:XP_635291.1 hypothetical protein DDB_G0291552 [Dictyostelium discoideum AX4]